MILFGPYKAICRDMVVENDPAFGAFLVIAYTLAMIVLIPITVPLWIIGKGLEKWLK